MVLANHTSLCPYNTFLIAMSGIDGENPQT